jgi:hypothetical protein
MAQARTPKTEKTAPAAVKKIITPKAKKVRAAAQTAETATIFSKPLEGLKSMKTEFKTAAAQAAEKATSFGKEAVEFSKANLEAITASGKIAAKGAQEATQTAVELGKKNWEATTAHAKAVAAVKAPADFFQLQNDFARTQFDAVVAQFAKNSEFALKLAGEVVAPLQNRYAVVTEQVKARMAA